MRTNSTRATTFGRTLLAMSFVAGCGNEVTEPLPAPARITLNRVSAAFEAVQGDAEPAPVDVGIINTGEAPLSGLTANIEYVSGPPYAWLTTSLDASVAPATLRIATAASSAPAGTYEAIVHVVASEADNSPQDVAVSLTVTLPPEPARIGLSDNRIEFTMQEGEQAPAPRTLAVTNEGELALDDLTVSLHFAVGVPSGWIDATLDSVGAPTLLHVAVDPAGLAPGTYRGTLFLLSDAASNSPLSQAVSLTITAATPIMTVEPDQARFVATEGRNDPDVQTHWIRNGGLGVLRDISASVDYPAGHPTGWLSLSLNQTTAPALLTLTPGTGSLAPGAHEATVTVESPEAGNGPQTIDVTFEIRPPGPVIHGDPQYVSFNAARGGVAPRPQTVLVTNADTGTLTDLRVETYTEVPWLTASLDRTTAPATLTLSVNPAGLPVDRYHADLYVSSPVAENQYANVAVLFMVDQGLPDLTLVGPFTVASPVPAGETTATEPFLRRNVGEEAAGAHRGGWYLSTDATIDENDVVLRSVPMSRLEVGQELTFPGSVLTIPADTPPGNYYVIVTMDDLDVVLESDETNNQLVAPIVVEPPVVRYPVTTVVEPAGAGTIVGVGDPIPERIPAGETRSLWPAPAEGWAFVSWGGDASGNAIPFDILVDADKTVIANFEPAPPPTAGSVAGR